MRWEGGWKPQVKAGCWSLSQEGGEGCYMRWDSLNSDFLKEEAPQRPRGRNSLRGEATPSLLEQSLWEATRSCPSKHRLPHCQIKEMYWKVGPGQPCEPQVWTSSPDILHPLRPPSKQIFSQPFFCSWLLSAPFSHANTLTDYAFLQVSHLVAYLHSCALETQSLWPLPASCLPLPAPHWVDPELRVPSDSVTRLCTLNPLFRSTGFTSPPPLHLRVWASHFSGYDSRCPSSGSPGLRSPRWSRLRWEGSPAPGWRTYP